MHVAQRQKSQRESPKISIREKLEAQEANILRPEAKLSADSQGRSRAEAPCPLRTQFQRDRDRILHSKAFRRLKHKTQVFISPVGDHYRTRLTHSLEVSQIARTLARALRLNEDLTESIALGHDLGHPPFGHAGEDVLNTLSPHGFSHTRQSIRIATVLEDLNLSCEVLEGISGQGIGERPQSLEGQVVELADRMAYLHHDVEDAVRAGLMQENDLPPDLLITLGSTRSERLDRMVDDLIQTTEANLAAGSLQVGLSPAVHQAMMGLRKWMFEHIYLSPFQATEKQKVEGILKTLYQYYLSHPDALSATLPQAEEPAQRVVDYIAGMTDRYALDSYLRIVMPQSYQPHLVYDHLFDPVDHHDETSREGPCHNEPYHKERVY